MAKIKVKDIDSTGSLNMDKNTCTSHSEPKKLSDEKF